MGEAIAGLYDVVSVLGEGGMGTVYKVRHRTWNLDLAVKCPRQAHFSRAGSENFVRECETWVRLGLHPHIVCCHYVRVMDGLPRVFAEYVSGGSLADWIRSRHLYRGGPDEALVRILDIAIQVAWGLDHAHEHGLVHQDMKPANVMMTSEGVAKITDFGLARARGATPIASSMSGHDSVIVASGGMTPAYCSPEQAAGGSLTRRSDIWSYAVSVLEMFTGEVTWLAGQLAALVLARHASAPPDEPFLPPVPPALTQLLMRCFAPDPQHRPARMQEVVDALVQLHRALTGSTYPRSAPRPIDSKAGSLNNRALSHLDLGDAEAALDAWQRANALDRLHLETVYNYALYRWRRSELSDDKVVAELAGSAASYANPSQGWLPGYLLACIHLERGALDEAARLLENLPSPVPPEVRLLRQSLQARSREVLGSDCSVGINDLDIAAAQCLHMLDRGAGSVSTHDGALILRLTSGEVDDQITLSGTTSGAVLWGVKVPRLDKVRRSTLMTRAPGTKACLSADAAVALVFAELGRVVVLDGKTGRPLHALNGINMDVQNAGLSEDGRLAVLVLGVPGSTKMGLWDVRSGQPLRSFEQRSGSSVLHKMQAVAVNASSGLAMSADSDSALRLWELGSGRLIRDFRGHAGPVRAVSLALDGSRAASLGDDRTVRLWDVDTGRCRITIASNESSTPVVVRPRVAPMRVAPVAPTEMHLERDREARAGLERAQRAIEERRPQDALAELRKVRATPGWEREPAVLQAWQTLSWLCRKSSLLHAWQIWPLPGAMPLTSIALSNNGKLALAGDARGMLRVLDLAAGRERASTRAHGASIDVVCLARDATVAISSGHAGVRLWRLPDLHPLRRLDVPGLDEFYRHESAPVHISADGRLAMVATHWEVSVYDVETGHLLRTLKVPGRASQVVYISPDGQQAFGADREDAIMVWDLPSGRLLRTIAPEPEGEHARGDPLQSERGLERLSGHQRAFSMAADMRTLVYSSPCRRPRWIDLSNGQSRTPPLQMLNFLGVAGAEPRYFLAHALHGATRSERGLQPRALQLWDVERGELLHAFAPRSARAKCLCLSADLSTAAACFEDGEAQFWRLDWDLVAHVNAQEGEDERLLLPHLELFLRLNTPLRGSLDLGGSPSEGAIESALTRRGSARWSEETFDSLIVSLREIGLGLVPPERVRALLEDLRSRAQAQR